MVATKTKLSDVVFRSFTTWIVCSWKQVNKKGKLGAVGGILEWVRGNDGGIGLWIVWIVHRNRRKGEGTDIYTCKRLLTMVGTCRSSHLSTCFILVK